VLWLAYSVQIIIHDNSKGRCGSVISFICRSSKISRNKSKLWRKNGTVYLKLEWICTEIDMLRPIVHMQMCPPPSPLQNAHARTFANIAKRLFVHSFCVTLNNCVMVKLRHKNVTIYWSFRVSSSALFSAHPWTFVTRNAHCQNNSIFTLAVHPMRQDQVASQNTSQYILHQ